LAVDLNMLYLYYRNCYDRPMLYIKISYTFYILLRIPKDIYGILLKLNFGKKRMYGILSAETPRSDVELV
jgi:hypothetical protein